MTYLINFRKFNEVNGLCEKATCEIVANSEKEAIQLFRSQYSDNYIEGIYKTITLQQKQLLEALENGEVFTFLSNDGGKLSHKDLFVLAFELAYQASEKMTIEERKQFESNIAKELKERYF